MKALPMLWVTPLVALLAACGSDVDDPPAAPAAPTQAAAPSEHEEPAARPAAADAPTRIGARVDREAAAAARQAPDARERSRQVRAALRTARTAAHGDQHAAALPHFERALELAPSDERLLCETGYVAYRAGNLERAAELVNRALTRFGNPQQVAEALRVPLAMCLYNAGRVAEARSRTGEAREHYRTSLMLRDNATVRARVEALGDASAAEAPRAAGVATLDALLSRLRTARCADADADAEEGNPFPCTVEIDREVTASSADFRGAALIRVVTGDLGSETYLELALHGRDGWHPAGTVLYVYNPGMFGISEEGEVGALTFASLVPGGPEELRFDVTHSRSDSDLGIDEAEYGSDAATVVCGLVGSALRCARLPREHSFTRERIEGSEQAEAGLAPAGLPVQERYVITLAFEPDAGTLTLRASEGALPAQLSGWAGTHPLQAILGSPDLGLRVDY